MSFLDFCYEQRKDEGQELLEKQKLGIDITDRIVR